MNVRVALLQIASQHTKSGQRGVAGCPGIPGQIKSVWVAGSPRNTQAGKHSNWQWHLDEVFVKINGERFYLWRAVDHEGEVLECYISKRRDRHAAKKFLIKTMRKHGSPRIITTDKLAS